MKVYEAILERREDETAGLVLAYRGWQKSVSSNYRAYLELLSPDGRLRPNYKLHGTVTGRMSCEKPNLQQIPKVSNKPWNGSMKACFVPRQGYSLYEADYSQLELRLAASYAQEESLKSVFLEGRDVFTEMSKELGMTRNDTKTLVYTIQYGGGIQRLTDVFGISPDRAADIRDSFYRSYPGFRRVTKNAESRALSVGKLATWSKRYRHFLYPKNDAFKGFNSVIQGGAADIVERAMVRLDERVDSDDCRMLLQVHDSVVFELKTGRESYYLPLIQSTMEDIPEPFGVKFAVEVKEWGT
jgi:DNA polymerase-1